MTFCIYAGCIHSMFGVRKGSNVEKIGSSTSFIKHHLYLSKMAFAKFTKALPPSLSLAGHTAIVTGASSGIGRQSVS